MKDFTRHTLCPLLAAFIWGTAFSAQSMCGEHLQTFTINAARSLIAAFVLIMFCLMTKRNPGNIKKLAIGGVSCGTALYTAVNLQQYGITVSGAGKAGFITALYIVIIPALGLLLNKRVGLKIWLAVGIAVAGMYFLCISDGFTIGVGDISLLLCAFMFAVQMLFVDHYANLVDNIALSAVQFLVVGALSAISAIVLKERAAFLDFKACIWPLLYVALFSSCIAYTLQIIGQKGGNPAIVALLLSLESVFALLGGVVLLHETLTDREWLGCALMAAAITLTQLPDKSIGTEG